jgi:hypothetical protein
MGSISGLQVGNTSLTISDTGQAVCIAMSRRFPGELETRVLEVTITPDQSCRLRRMMAWAEKRAKEAAHDRP